jgi:hypothetical protein
LLGHAGAVAGNFCLQTVYRGLQTVDRIAGLINGPDMAQDRHQPERTWPGKLAAPKIFHMLSTYIARIKAVGIIDRLTIHARDIALFIHPDRSPQNHPCAFAAGKHHRLGAFLQFSR